MGSRTSTSLLRDFEQARAFADTVPLDAVEVQDAEQHVGRLPNGLIDLVREHEMTIASERAVESSDQDDGTLLVTVQVRVAHIAALVDQDVIQDRAVPVGDVPQPLAEVRQVLHVIPVDLGVVGDVLGIVAVVR